MTKTSLSLCLKHLLFALIYIQQHQPIAVCLEGAQLPYGTGNQSSQDVLMASRFMCEYILGTFPHVTGHSSAFWKELVPPLPPPRGIFSKQQSRAEQCKNWLINQCAHRGMALYFEHCENIYKTNVHQTSNQYNFTKNKRRNLFVLDLDESLVYQRESLTPYTRFSELRSHNKQDLKLSIFAFMCDRVFNLRLVVYRPYLMEFIMQHIHDSDFVIYSLAQFDVAINVAVSIETFYNFYWRSSHLNSLKATRTLRFEAVIARFPNKMKKSIGMLNKILNVGKYSDVYVVDDLFDGPINVWIKSVPPNIVSDGIKFHGWRIPAFMDGHKIVQKQLLPSQIYKNCLQIRSADKALQNVNISQTLTLENSVWSLFGGLSTPTNKNRNPLLPPHRPRPAKRFDTEPKFEMIK